MTEVVVWFFSYCVRSMIFLADVFSLSYKEINALVFLLLQPSLILLFLVLWMIEKKKTAALIQHEKETLNEASWVSDDRCVCLVIRIDKAVR